jgi:hypothetical protein
MTLGPAAPFSANQDIILPPCRAHRETDAHPVECTITQSHSFCCCGGTENLFGHLSEAQIFISDDQHYSSFFIDFREADYHQLRFRTEGIQIDKT